MEKINNFLKHLGKKEAKKTIISVFIFICVTLIIGLIFFYSETTDSDNFYKQRNQTLQPKEIVATKEFRIIIPQLEINERVYEGKDEKTLDKGPAHYPDTAFPKSNSGNVVISGHSATTKKHGSPFKRVDELKNGDTIYLSKNNKLYEYKVTENKVVASTEMSVIEPSEKPILTLITCIKPNYPRDKRLIIIAEKIS